MTTEEREKIRAWLLGPRDHTDGVSLYIRYGANLRLRRLFTIDETATTRQILVEELRKLAGMTEAELTHLPRRACKGNPLQSHESPEERKGGYAEPPATVKKMLRLRERYPFLNSEDCPDELKVLVADMISAFYRYKEAHVRLQAIPSGDVAAAAPECAALVEDYLKNREIRAELDHYLEHGELLGKTSCLRSKEPEEDLSQISDLDLMKQLNSAAANESKQRKAVNASLDKGETNERAEAALARWSSRKAALQEEVARRKKK